MMRNTRTKGMLLTLGCAACLTVPIHGEEWSFRWNNPCPPQSLEGCGGIQGLGAGGFLCWCMGQWYDENDWNGILGGFPDDPSQSVQIKHSNVGHCSNNGNICDTDSECQPPPHATCDVEDYILIRLADVTVAWLEIETLATMSANDHLDIRFASGLCIGGTNSGDPCPAGDSDCTGGYCDDSLQVDILALDALNGPVTITVTETARIQTDLTD